MTLRGTTTLGQSGPESTGNEGVLEPLELDDLVFYPGHHFFLQEKVGGDYISVRIYSQPILGLTNRVYRF